jgi:hypothetical protein
MLRHTSLGEGLVLPDCWLQSSGVLEVNRMFARFLSQTAR